MGVRHVCYLLLAAAAVAACGDQQQPEVTGPQFKPQPTTDPCNYGAVGSSIISYFPGNRQAPILALQREMEDSGVRTPGAIDLGFEIMDSIGKISRDAAGTVSPSAGAQLTIALISCMVDSASVSYPDDDPLGDFTQALTSLAGGAYYVRGGHAGGRSGDILGINKMVSPQNNLSGVEPVSGSEWVDVVTSPANDQALIYGFPVDVDNYVYEWATVPSGPETQFLTGTGAPGAVVSVCDGDEGTTAMVHETNIGVLAYQGTSVCNGLDWELTLNDGERGGGSLMGRVVHAVASVLAPAPLQATTVLKSGSGGTATTFKSEFSKQLVPTVTLDPVSEPPALIKGTYPTFKFALEYNVSASGAALFGTCVFVTGTNNNGAPTELVGPKECAPPAGFDPAAVLSVLTKSSGDPTYSVADFGDVGVTKTGGITFSVYADVQGRDGVSATLTYKSNVKPAK